MANYFWQGMVCPRRPSFSQFGVLISMTNCENYRNFGNDWVFLVTLYDTMIVSAVTVLDCSPDILLWAQSQCQSGEEGMQQVVLTVAILESSIKAWRDQPTHLNTVASSTRDLALHKMLGETQFNPRNPTCFGAIFIELFLGKVVFWGQTLGWNSHPASWKMS